MKEGMRVLLVNAIFRRKLGESKRISTILPPIGLAYLAAVLKKEGIKVTVLDMNALNIEPKDIRKHILKYNPEIVGFSVTTPVAPQVFEMASIVKKINHKIKTVVGGPHVTALPEEAIKKDFIDFIVIGEGETTFLELIKNVEKGEQFEKIDGIMFRKGTRIVRTKEREKIKNLDELPFPAIELLPMERYVSADSEYKKFATILTSRGCPARCIYCNKLVFGNTCHMRSAKNIIKEIDSLKKNYGYKEFHILDDLFTANRQRVVDFCNIVIRRDMKIRWKCGNGVRVGTVDFGLLKLMKKAGCYSLSYGIESGNQQILNNMRKGQTLKQCRNAVKWTIRAGLTCVGFFMFGNLGENEETMRETLEFAKSLDLDVAQFHILVPYPGTIIREIIEKEGKIFENDWGEYDNLVGKAVFEHGELKKESMEKIHKDAYKEFYMRPSFIIKQIFKRRSLRQIKNRINGFLTLIEY